MQNLRFVSGSSNSLGRLLVSRGSAMGPLLPLVALVPLLILAAWALKGVLVIWNVPILSVCFSLAAFWIILQYYRQYERFAKTDPDRLQSENYRYETARMQLIAAKGLPYPMPAESLAIDEPGTNDAKHGIDDKQTNDGEMVS